MFRKKSMRAIGITMKVLAILGVLNIVNAMKKGDLCTVLDGPYKDQIAEVEVVLDGGKKIGCKMHSGKQVKFSPKMLIKLIQLQKPEPLPKKPDSKVNVANSAHAIKRIKLNVGDKCLVVGGKYKGKFVTVRELFAGGKFGCLCEDTNKLLKLSRENLVTKGDKCTIVAEGEYENKIATVEDLTPTKRTSKVTGRRDTTFVVDVQGTRRIFSVRSVSKIKMIHNPPKMGRPQHKDLKQRIEQLRRQFPEGERILVNDHYYDGKFKGHPFTATNNLRMNKEGEFELCCECGQELGTRTTWYKWFPVRYIKKDNVAPQPKAAPRNVADQGTGPYGGMQLGSNPVYADRAMAPLPVQEQYYVEEYQYVPAQPLAQGRRSQPVEVMWVGDKFRITTLQLEFADGTILPEWDAVVVGYEKREDKEYVKCVRDGTQQQPLPEYYLFEPQDLQQNPNYKRLSTMGKGICVVKSTFELEG